MLYFTDVFYLLLCTVHWVFVQLCCAKCILSLSVDIQIVIGT